MSSGGALPSTVRPSACRHCFRHLLRGRGQGSPRSSPPLPFRSMRPFGPSMPQPVPGQPLTCCWRCTPSTARFSAGLSAAGTVHCAPSPTSASPTRAGCIKSLCLCVCVLVSLLDKFLIEFCLTLAFALRFLFSSSRRSHIAVYLIMTSMPVGGIRHTSSDAFK